MKTHTSDYKYEIKEFGRQITSKITYGNVELGEDDLNSITPSFESSILKSAMKRLEIDSNVEIPLETEINYQFGCLVGDEYEYIDFGNYIVYSSEKHEDTNSYYIIAYDKMLYAMKDYEDLGITYPITIRNYINAICTKLGLTFANASDTFANYDKEIQHELYLNGEGESIGYTYRDVLDEIAQVTASTICINDDDELEIRYINDTNDTIDEEYLRDVNVSFGEKYGPVNSIVLARAESDKIYLKDYESVEENGLCEIMINDNQIMNGQDRNTYLPDILEELDGLEYYLNDFTSTGITYYDICDRYNIQIGENTYSCIMFNDSIEVTQGLNETIYTDRLEESETDYKKADKEDRKINQTRIVVDKHNQEISTLISYVGDRSEKQTSLTQDVDGLISQVQNIPTIATEGSGYGSVTLTELANTKIAMIKVHPTNVDIIRNVVSEHLKVRIGNKVGHRGLTFIQEEESELKLPRNLFFYDNETYDEFVLDGVEERMYVIHRVGFQNGVKVMLDTPIIEEFEYQDIIIDEGTLTITYNDYPSAYIYLKAMIKNEFTDTFATKLEMNSTIEQTANSIMLEVNQKTDKDEIIAQLNVAVEDGQGIIDLKGNSVTIESDNFELDADGKISAKAGDIGGFMLDDKSFKKTINGIYDYSIEDEILAYYIYSSKLKNYTNVNYILDYNENGSIDFGDVSKIYNIINGQTDNDRTITGTFEINSNNPKQCLVFKDNNGNIITTIGLSGINTDYIFSKNIVCGTPYNQQIEGCLINGDDGTITIQNANGSAYTKIEAGKITLVDSNGTKIITTTS